MSRTQPLSAPSRRPGLLLALACMFAGMAAHAAEPSTHSATPAVPAHAAQCMTCHGPVGVAQNPEWPIISGQNALYIRKALLAYRSGERQDSMMRLITAPLSDGEIGALADYFSQLRPRQGLKYE